MSNAQILVVEDEGIVARSLRNELQNMGYEVPAIAASGEEAVAKAAGTHPDLVLMDISLKGGMDGIEAARQIQKTIDVPVIYLSAYEDDTILDRAKTTEPYGYLLKPYEERELHTTIEMALVKHRMEQRIKETERWLAATLRGIHEAVIATDARRHIRFMNPVAERLTGWDETEAFGKDLAEVLPLIDEASGLPMTNVTVRPLHEGQAAELPERCLLCSADGRHVPVEGNAAPILDDAGYCTGCVLVVRDISERRQVEKLRRQSEEHLRHSQKMEAVSRLAGGVAHDFNNLLTAILGNTSLILANLPPNDPHLDLLVNAEAAALRAAELVKQMLGFSRRTCLWLEPANLNDIVQEDVDALRLVADTRMVIDFQPGAELWPIRTDRAQMSEVVMNLCLNAQDAMPQGGSLTIEPANVTVTEECLRKHLEAQPGEFVRLRVRDTGRGIPADIQARIFEPFFTTKEPGQGTGLGLALVYGIVEQHHGWIDFTSEENRGSCFDVYLPRYWQDMPLGAPPMEAKPPRGVAETILLADDEPMIRELGRTTLQRCGYHVLLAEDGVQAVEIYQKEKHRIDLVILDLTMPRLSGADAFLQLTQIDPNVHVLFSSGYFAEDLATSDDRILGFIDKPYRTQDLIHMVRRGLDLAKEAASRGLP
jgi:two-component system, cell cycle sensor histidine kinase and response regulator CckA